MIGQDAILEAAREAGEVFIRAIAEEIEIRGHVLSGAGIQSLRQESQARGNMVVVRIIAADYMSIVNTGFPKESASMKQFPFLVEYFMDRGYGEDDAKRFAAATINTWKKEKGMSTIASREYSRNRKRNEFVAAAVEIARDKARAKMVEVLRRKSFDWIIAKLKAA